MRLLIVWILNALALLAVAYLVPSLVQVAGFSSALIAALVLGLVNTLVRPVLAFLTLPLTVLTLGLFFLVLNGLLFWAVASLVDGFNVGGFWPAVFGGMLYGVISWILSALVPGKSRASDD
ncbi:phage holin family protein [soil metagenome]